MTTPPPPPPLFPYMVWAHVAAHASASTLAHSGMPAPDAAWLTERFRLDLSHPAAEAQPALERAVAARHGVPPERVLATVGASGAMAVVASALFRGARVVTELPSYEPFRVLPRLAGAELRVVRRRHEEGWRLDPARVAAELEGARPGHAFLCTPHNPTGAAAAPDELRALAAACADAGGVLVANEVYLEMAPRADRAHAATLAPNALSIGSLTKAYGLGPLRVGWIVLGEGLAHLRPLLLDHAYLQVVDPPTPSLRAGALALSDPDRLEAPLRRLERESRPLLARFLAETPGLDGALGAIGLTAFPRVRGVDDTAALAARLAERHAVDVVPGEFFGAPGHVRLGWGQEPDALAEALRRLGGGLRAEAAGR